MTHPTDKMEQCIGMVDRVTFNLQAAINMYKTCRSQHIENLMQDLIGKLNKEAMQLPVIRAEIEKDQS